MKIYFKFKTSKDATHMLFEQYGTITEALFNKHRRLIFKREGFRMDLLIEDCLSFPDYRWEYLADHTDEIKCGFCEVTDKDTIFVTADKEMLFVKWDNYESG